MVKLENEDKQPNILIKIINKIISISLLFISISIFLIMITFSADDPGWNYVSDKIPGFLTTLICFSWSLKLLNKSIISFFKLKLASFFLMIFLSIIGGAYIEKILNNYFKINFAIINQNGFPEWILSY